MFHTCLLKFIYSVFIIQCNLYEMFTECLFVPPCFVSKVEVIMPADPYDTCTQRLHLT